MTRYDELVRDLQAEGVVLSVRPSGLLVTSTSERDFDPPVRLAFTAEQFEGAVAAGADDAEGLWSDVSLETASYRLLLLHLGTELRLYALPGSTIELRSQPQRR